MQDLASAVLSRRYEEQLFQQVSSHNRGTVAEMQAMAVGMAEQQL